MCEWTNVVDGLPEDGDSVFMRHELNAMYAGYYYNKTFRIYNVEQDRPISVPNITHWLLIPELERV